MGSCHWRQWWNWTRNVSLACVTRLQHCNVWSKRSQAQRITCYNSQSPNQSSCYWPCFKDLNSRVQRHSHKGMWWSRYFRCILERRKSGNWSSRYHKRRLAWTNLHTQRSTCCVHGKDSTWENDSEKQSVAGKTILSSCYIKWSCELCNARHHKLLFNQDPSLQILSSNCWRSKI